jgi:hypothetical protein
LLFFERRSGEAAAAASTSAVVGEALGVDAQQESTHRRGDRTRKKRVIADS